MWDFNPHTFTDAHYNDRWFTMLGYEPDELPHTAETWIKLVHPEDLELVQRKLQDHIEKKGEYSAEFHMKTKDGSYRWIHSIGKIVSWDNKGNPQRMVGIHMDIDDQKTSESERKKLEAQLQPGSN
jgi:PAS domain S-box-containing protein